MILILWNAPLVVLYMVNQLLLPGHVEHIGGFAEFRAALEPLSTQALASRESLPNDCASSHTEVVIEFSRSYHCC